MRPLEWTGASLRRIGAIPAGTLVLAAATYAFLVLAARVLGPEGYASFAVVWALVFFAGPGVFTPVEQQAARGVAASRAVGAPLRADIVRSARASACLCVVLLALLAGLRGLAQRELQIDDALLVGLAASLLGLSVAHPIRGVLAGLGRLPGYGRGLALEGLLRLAGGVALATSGTRSAALFAVLAGVPAGAGAALGVLGRSRVRSRNDSAPVMAVEGILEAPSSERASALLPLVIAALCGQLLINIAPVAVAVLATASERVAAGQLLAGLLIARVPLLAIATVQTVVLPQLVALYAAGRAVEAVMVLRRVAVACALLAAGGGAVAASVGPYVMRLVFGPAFALTGLDLVLLVVAVCAYLAATLLGLGLVARRKEAILAWSWVAGVAAAFVVLVLVPGLLLRVELALVVGCITSAVLVAWSSARVSRRWHP